MINQGHGTFFKNVYRIDEYCFMKKQIIGYTDFTLYTYTKKYQNSQLLLHKFSNMSL